jgi:1-acyl-sn-glycerol-3-phosphate acyltransferase
VQRGGAELAALRAAGKLLALSLLVAVALPAQLLVLACTRGPASMKLPRRFHAVFARILGLRVEYRGEPLQGRGVVHVGNHLSYLDVPVLGQRLATRFVAKEDVRGWPLFGLLARLQQTLFVSRSRQRVQATGAMLSQALEGVHGLFLFPEGTTSDGSRLLPFKPGAFAPLVAREGLQLQPVRIELLAVDGVDIAEGGNRDLYAYHGDASLLPHLWRFLCGRGARLRVSFLAPIPHGPPLDRKRLALAAWSAVAGVEANATLADSVEA